MTATAPTPPTVADIVRGPVASYYVDVTPEMAEAWLASNPNNRNLSEAKVREYLAALERGQWRITPEPIMLAPCGRLLNGQHRLTMVVRHGAPVTLAVAFDVDESVFVVIDTGKKRSASDALKIAGHDYINSRAAAARTLTAWMRSGKPDSSLARLTNEDVLAFNERHARLMRRAVDTWARHRKGLENLGYKSGIGVTLVALFMAIDIEDAELFFDALATGSMLPDGDPILALRDAMMRNDRAMRKTGMTRAYQSIIAAYTVKGWNAMRTGKKIQMIRWNPDNDFPQVNGWDGTLPTGRV